ncbi:MAG: pyridoxal-phosphate dependent enzyme [Planctomycetota bacterium]|nr:MAG: pyridoxal-phosphate dependent enzyme [Planctomycetota bacterium]
MVQLGLEREVVDGEVRRRAVRHLAERGVVLPRFAQLAEPGRIPAQVRKGLARVDPDAADPLNLFRIHWYNAADRRGLDVVPGHLVLPPELTGVEATIAVALGERFPMIGAHKVLAAYGCLAPRLVTGQFDPTRHKALWPSTGNYCRGGVAVSRIMGCRGVAILPEGMSRERFDWLARWVADPADVVRTPGSESNVKEIYDACAELGRDPANVVFNQFCEFGNALAHYLVTGRALGHLYEHLRGAREGLELFAFVSATGSAGTIAAGDRLKEKYGARIVAVEALECPTLLANGFGEHNIQGIGDKHVPYIHNVTNTDAVVAVSDRATDSLAYVFGDPVGRRYLEERRGVPAEAVAGLAGLGYSGICNVLAAIKLAKHFGLGPEQCVLTVATDSAAMYRSERPALLARRFGNRFDEVRCAEAVGEHLLGAGTDHLRELTHEERQRIFNLGYFTWVEQQGVPLKDFVARREQRFWRGLRGLLGAWDDLIASFNEEVAAQGAG